MPAQFGTMYRSFKHMLRIYYKATSFYDGIKKIFFTKSKTYPESKVVACNCCENNHHEERCDQLAELINQDKHGIHLTLYYTFAFV